jgi:hypothetical protein
MLKKFPIKKASLLLALGLCTSTAWAHHGGGTFDANKCYSFKGAVRQVAWANPHAWLYVTVDKPGSAPELWGFEFGTVGSLSRAGFRPSDFAQGSKVSLVAYSNREVVKHTASVTRLILADGRDVTGAGVAGTAPSNAPAPAAGAGPGAAPAAANCPEYK